MALIQFSLEQKHYLFFILVIYFSLVHGELIIWKKKLRIWKIAAFILLINKGYSLLVVST